MSTATDREELCRRILALPVTESERALNARISAIREKIESGEIPRPQRKPKGSDPFRMGWAWLTTDLEPEGSD